MKCRNCGKENANGDIYCIYCGSKLENDPVEAENAVTKNVTAKNAPITTESVITGKVSERRSVQSILEEYLPQLSKTAGDRGGFVIAPNVDMENCRQKSEELLKDVFPFSKKRAREECEIVMKSIRENGETIQGVFVSGFSKLQYIPAVWFFSDRAVYAYWNNYSAWYLMNSGGKKKHVSGCRCRYDAIDEVSCKPTKLSEGLGGFGTEKVSCSLVNSAELFEFAFEEKYIREDQLIEMIRLLKDSQGG